MTGRGCLNCTTLKKVTASCGQPHQLGRYVVGYGQRRLGGFACVYRIFDLHVLAGRFLNIIPCVPDNFFHNEGGVFYEDSTGFFDVEALSFAAVTGDFNLDGFPDLVNHLVGEYAQVWKPFPTTTGGSKSGLKAPSATATASAQRFAFTGTACSDTI